MNIPDVVRQFKKVELAQVADEIGLKYDPSKSAKELAEALTNKLYSIATDDNIDMELSDLAYEVAITAEIIDEEGELIEEVVKVERKACFGFADVLDPNCKICPQLEDCKIERVRIRPACFGTAKRDEKNPECRICIEFFECAKKQ